MVNNDYEGILKSVNKELKDYLTFYHELRIPENSYFDLKRNQNKSNKLLMVASPSRMGNHLLLSMLDNHPELPRIPGEDGFLYYSFLKANYDTHEFIKSIKGPNSLKFIMTLGSNGGRNKWREFKKYSDKDITDLGYAGIQVDKNPSVLDFEGVVFDINYQSFEDHLRKHLDCLRKSNRFKDVFQNYLDALQLLDFESKKTIYDSYIAFGGMRVQTKWICETYGSVKVLCSLRSFDSYCISQIKSKHGNVALSPELIQTAWEHWYHKVIDRIYLKIKYPEKIGLVIFKDLIKNSIETQQNICSFLGINYHKNLQKATIFGNSVRGNSWSSRSDDESGEFYEPKEKLNQLQVPHKHGIIWDKVKLLTLNSQLY